MGKWKAAPDWQERLQEHLHACIASSGMSEREVCRRAGISKSTMRSWGQPHSQSKKYVNPNMQSLVPLCEALGISPEALFQGARLGK
tara:strand:+ start:5473 stop:5733 length:261 start_codon:yes stop_codon:yes gene_type:complete